MEWLHVALFKFQRGSTGLSKRNVFRNRHSEKLYGLPQSANDIRLNTPRGWIPSHEDFADIITPGLTRLGSSTALTTPTFFSQSSLQGLLLDSFQISPVA